MPQHKRDFLRVSDFGAKEIVEIFDKTKELKVKKFSEDLRNRAVGLIFQKPSLRTRVSFQVGVWQLGGQCMSLSPAEVNIGVRESVKDSAKTLSRYLDLLMARVFKHKDVEELAEFADVPVINGLSDAHHPCQAMADLFTLYERRGQVKGATLAFVGDGNNVCNSLLEITSLLGVNMTVASPKGFSPSKAILEYVYPFSKKSGSQITVTNDAREAVRGVDVIYTDVWASMGQEKEALQRAKIFKKFQINRDLLSVAKKDVLVMHCLPAHRGQEITDDVIDGLNSVVFDEAENRLHVQKAIMLKLLAE